MQGWCSTVPHFPERIVATYITPIKCTKGTPMTTISPQVNLRNPMTNSLASPIAPAYLNESSLHYTNHNMVARIIGDICLPRQHRLQTLGWKPKKNKLKAHIRGEYLVKCVHLMHHLSSTFGTDRLNFMVSLHPCGCATLRRCRRILKFKSLYQSY